MEDHSSIERDLQEIYAEELDSSPEEAILEEIQGSVRRSVAAMDLLTLTLGRLWQVLTVMLGGGSGRRGN